MRAARVRLETWLWRHGFAWPVAAVLAAVALGLYLGVERAHQAGLADLRAAAAAQSSGKPQPEREPTSAADDLRELIASSAPADQVLARIAQIARAEGIVLPQGDYQQRVVQHTSFVQLQVVQPVRATYPQLRRYVEAVLRTVPNASLEQLAARRDNVGQPQLEARVRWSIWLPQAPKQERPTP